jgi:hypothetical protein
MSEQSEERLDAWSRSPETQGVAKLFMDERAKTFETLLGACKSSSDPAVRGLVATLTEQDKFAVYCGGKSKALLRVVQNAR